MTATLIHGDARHFLAHEGDAPSGVQLGGSDPDELAHCARLVEDAGYQEVNLNVGCPSDRVQYNRIGACLMADPALVARCFNAMQSAVDIPVTIKTRIGIDDKDDYDFFRAFVATLCAAGCRTFMVHARKAILSGLSPKENRQIPPLRYEYVERIKADYPDCQFILNGGIDEAARARELLQSFEGIMLGRAAYHRPLILAELESAIVDHTTPEPLTILRAYQAYMERQAAAGERTKHMAKHLLGLFAGYPGARRFRRHLSEHMYRDDAGPEVIDEAVSFLMPQLARAS